MGTSIHPSPVNLNPELEMLQGPMTLTKVLAGYYKLTAPSGFFSNIDRGDDGQWRADIRKPSGELKRFAGIWPTRRDAIEEASDILYRDCF